MGNVMVIPAKGKLEILPDSRMQSLSSELRRTVELVPTAMSRLQVMKLRLSITQNLSKRTLNGNLQAYMLMMVFQVPTLKNRDEFNRMIEDCEAGTIDMIITKSISRFARNTLDCLKYIRQLKDKNIPVFFEKEAINTMTPKVKS